MSMRRTVKQLAKVSGVSVPTLHHYHAIDLLMPAEIDANGYRWDGRAELLRLQQILFFRSSASTPRGSARSSTHRTST